MLHDIKRRITLASSDIRHNQWLCIALYPNQTLYKKIICRSSEVCQGMIGEGLLTSYPRGHTYYIYSSFHKVFLLFMCLKIQVIPPAHFLFSYEWVFPLQSSISINLEFMPMKNHSMRFSSHFINNSVDVYKKNYLIVIHNIFVF